MAIHDPFAPRVRRPSRPARVSPPHQEQSVPEPVVPTPDEPAAEDLQTPAPQAPEPTEEPIPAVQVDTPKPPPRVGPGSGTEPWREFASQVTNSPLQSWAGLNRKEIIELLENQGLLGDD
jgi:hypothetical protein